jgi:hypothetical protein
MELLKRRRGIQTRRRREEEERCLIQRISIATLVVLETLLVKNLYEFYSLTTSM